MAETMTQTTYAGVNPILEPRTFWRVSAFALAAIAALGFVINLVAGNEQGIKGFLVFDWGHNVVHLLLAVVAFVFGFAAIAPSASRMFAVVFGVIYAGLGVFGFFVDDLGFLALELGENLVHLVLGAWGLAVGLMGRT